MLLKHIGFHRHVCVHRLARHQTLPVGHIPTPGRQKEQRSTSRGRCSSHNLGCMCVQWNKGCLLFTCKLNCSLLVKHLESYVREVASSGCHAESPALVSGNWYCTSMRESRATNPAVLGFQINPQCLRGQPLIT